MRVLDPHLPWFWLLYGLAGAAVAVVLLPEMQKMRPLRAGIWVLFVVCWPVFAVSFVMGYVRGYVKGRWGR